MTAPIPSQNRARVKVRRRPIAAPATPKASRSVPIRAAANACRSCDAKLTIRKRLFCDQCLPESAKRGAKPRDPGLQRCEDRKARGYAGVAAD